MNQRCFHLEEENTNLKSQSSNLSRTLQAAELRSKELEDTILEEKTKFITQLEEVNERYMRFRRDIWHEPETVEA